MYLCFIALWFPIYAIAQQQQVTQMPLTIAQAEKQFFEKNYQLLALKYGIEAARAQALQASLWDNPQISIEQNIYNPLNKRYFDVTSSGNTDVQIQQLILLGGKRGKLVDVQNINTELAELQFKDAVRTLTFTLRSTFYEAAFTQKILQVYDKGIASVQKTYSTYKELQKKNIISLQEYLRLQSLLLSLEKEQQEWLVKLQALQSDLRVLMADSSNQDYNLDFPINAVAEFEPLQKEEDILVQKALERRADIVAAEKNIALQTSNAEYQQSLAIPDLTVGALWSRAGSFVQDYYAVTIGTTLPIFNRNQGGIQNAEALRQAALLQARQTKQQLQSDIRKALHKFQTTEKLYKKYKETASSDYEQLLQALQTNYEKRNISVLEFTDSFQAYKESMIQLLQIANDKISAYEELELAVGSTLR